MSKREQTLCQCQKEEWRGRCCCTCRHRMKLVEATPPYRQHGYVCLGFHDMCMVDNEVNGAENPTDEVHTGGSHGICELWMEVEVL
jgi:hypothetical protein